MSHTEHKEKAKKSLRCAVLTVSDTRNTENDFSGKTAVELLKKHGHVVALYEISRDEKDEILKFILKSIECGVDAVITNGGTGISKRDVTIEAVSEIIEKELKGFGELFRYLSYKEIGSSAIMSRALAGTYKNKIIISIPGSPAAVKLAMENLIIPEIEHMVWEVNK